MRRTTFSRRDVLLGTPLCLSACTLGPSREEMLRSVEAEVGGRIGASIFNVSSGRRAAYRGAERFALCSTFKAPLAAAVLAQIDAGVIHSSAVLDLNSEPLLFNSPVSAAYASEGKIPLMLACEAAVTQSDNTAANCLLRLAGGPSAMTRFFRSLGDDATRLDRYELELNSNLPGDTRDTTTPDAMVTSLHALLLGDALAPKSRDLLTGWMLNEQRGKARIRAGVPASWRVANKPGTSANGATNDIAVVWNTEQRPMVLAVYINAPAASIAKREAAIASVARSLALDDV